MTCDRADKSTQMCATKPYAVQFTNMWTWKEATEENNNPQVFVPASVASHRPLERESIEGTLVKKGN